jgi:hypothetical protein
MVVPVLHSVNDGRPKIQKRFKALVPNPFTVEEDSERGLFSYLFWAEHAICTLNETAF